MSQRTQITLSAEQHRKAKKRAGELGISLAEYMRQLVARDLGGTRPQSAPDGLFDLGTSGGSDVAASKDRMIGEAVEGGRGEAGG